MNRLFIQQMYPHVSGDIISEMCLLTNALFPLLHLAASTGGSEGSQNISNISSFHKLNKHARGVLCQASFVNTTSKVCLQSEYIVKCMSRRTKDGRQLYRGCDGTPSKLQESIVLTEPFMIPLKLNLLCADLMRRDANTDKLNLKVEPLISQTNCCFFLSWISKVS